MLKKYFFEEKKFFCRYLFCQSRLQNINGSWPSFHPFFENMFTKWRSFMWRKTLAIAITHLCSLTWFYLSVTSQLRRNQFAVSVLCLLHISQFVYRLQYYWWVVLLLLPFQLRDYTRWARSQFTLPPCIPGSWRVWRVESLVARLMP